MKKLSTNSGRLFQVGSSSYLYPRSFQSDGMRLLYYGCLKFLVAATRQFWFFFGAWATGVLVMVFRLEAYAVWVVGAMTIMLVVITVIEWGKLSEQEKNY